MEQSSYWIYILECENGSYYTGYTTDIERRYREHVDGTSSARYTRSFKPVRIAQCWQLTGSMGDALKVEKAVKRCARHDKERLVDSPDLLAAMVSESIGPGTRIAISDPEKLDALSRDT